MQLPKPGASYRRRVRFGRHVARKLLVAGFAAQAADVKAATDRVKQAGRAWEDAEDEQYEAGAAVESADDALDTLAQEGRNALSGRGVDAINQSPYTDIYPWGIGHYTAAPQAEQASRYRFLATQLTTHLAEGDPVRAQAAVIEAGVSTWEAARQGEALAERNTLQKSQTLALEEAALDRLLDKTYAFLRGEVGAKRAEKYFPKPSR